MSPSSPTHLSFAEQALHYFDRPHDDIRRTPIDSAAAWRGDQLRGSRDWIVLLSDGELGELDAALTAARSRGIELHDLDRTSFPLPTLAPRIADWAREVRDGRGFVLLRGLPVERWGDDDAALVYWGLGLHLGRPGAQNPDGDLLGHVVDMEEEADNPHVRRYRTAGDIAYHCDLADAVGLLCLRTPRGGGTSRIVSSVSVYDELLKRRPDLVDRLYEPFALDTRGEQGEAGPTHVPVPPCRYADGRLRTFYHSDYFRSAPRHADVAAFTDEERTLLDLYEEIAHSPELCLDMQLLPGDIQLLSNHTILHARKAYRDEADPRHKRHLLRLWLSL